MVLHWVHNLTPYIFKLGMLEIRWYGLMYVLGFIIFYYWMKHLMDSKQLEITPEQLENLFTVVIIGVLVGGRLGYVLFYNPSYYFHHPIDILKTWHGGMSFHGGMLGPTLLVAWYAHKNKLNFWDLIGYTATIAPITLFFGRLGNFINGELYGRPSTVPWAMIFPEGGAIPRHPSQLYEALLEGLILGVIMMILHKKRASNSVRFATSVSGYAIARIIVEFFRQPDSQLGYVLFGWVTQGQVLSFFMLLGGIAVFVWHFTYQKRIHE